MIKKYQRVFNLLQCLLDATVLVAAYAGSAVLHGHRHEPAGTATSLHADLVWIVPMLLGAYYLTGVYTPKRREMFRKEALTLVRAHVTGMAVISAVLYLRGSYGHPVVISGFAVTGLAGIIAERYVVRRTLKHFRSRGYNLKHLLVVGAGRIGEEFVATALRHPDFGYNVIGLLDDSPEKADSMVAGRRVIGTCRDLPGVLAGGGVDEVVVALPMRAYRLYGWIAGVCEKQGVRLGFIPEHYDILPGTMRIEDFDGIPLMNIRSMPLDDPFNRLLKRVLDLTVAMLAVMVAGPLMIVIAVVTKISSPGPVLFRQRRVGLNNAAFEMLKFRTMRVGDDASSDTRWTTPDDPRRTRFGSFLRRTSLDELPQFFNVLSGEMSVVGPRPERPFFVEKFKEDVPRYMMKHLVKPGITGWAQVNGWRGDTSIEKRVEYDIYYLENWDILFDVKVMVMTLFRCFCGRNAY